MSIKLIKKPTAATPSVMLTVKQAAQHLNLSERHIRRAIADGEIRVHRFGRNVRIAERDLAAYVNSRASSPF